MGQNTLKSAIFSLLDFSVLEPFGDANVQFWRTKITVIQVKKIKSYKGFICQIGRTPLFSLQMVVAWEGFFRLRIISKLYKKRNVNLLTVLRKD